jgi:hypothetical protein
MSKFFIERPIVAMVIAILTVIVCPFASATAAMRRTSEQSSLTLPGHGRRRHASTNDGRAESFALARASSAVTSQGSSSSRSRKGGRVTSGRPIRK